MEAETSLINHSNNSNEETANVVASMNVKNEERGEELLSFLHLQNVYKKHGKLNWFYQKYYKLRLSKNKYDFKFKEDLSWLIAISPVMLVLGVFETAIFIVYWVALFSYLSYHLRKVYNLGEVSDKDYEINTRSLRFSRNMKRIIKFGKELDIVNIRGLLKLNVNQKLTEKQEKSIYNFFKLATLFERYSMSLDESNALKSHRVFFEDKDIYVSHLFEQYKSLTGEEHNYSLKVKNLVYLGFSYVLIKFDALERSLNKGDKSDSVSVSYFKNREDKMKSFEKEFKKESFGRLKNLEK